MVVDGNGHVHAAALLGDDVWYVTNQSGAWIRALIDRPPQTKKDDHPQIAIDPADGSLAVVFSRRSKRSAPNYSEGGYLATNKGGSWSAPDLVLDSAEEPHVAVRNAAFYFAFDDQDVTKAVDLNDYTRPLFQAGPAAAPIELAPIGVVLAVQAVSGGGAQVMFASWSAGQSLRARIEVAHIDAANQVTTQELPVPRSDGWMARGSFSAGGAPLVTWDNKGGDHFAFENGSWTAPQELNGYAAALDDGGNAYGFNYSLSEVDADSVVASYFRNDGRQFSDLTDLVTTKGEIDPALALDGAGRAYILISTPAGLSYAVAPAVSGS